MAYVARKVPFAGTPDTNPETKPFFEGAAQGKLMVRRCTSCKKVHWYPRALCPFCFGECEWEQASGKGKIYTISVMERANPPYAIGYVELAEGAKAMTNFVECEFKDLKIGQDVMVTFVKTETEGVSLPMFKPA